MLLILPSEEKIKYSDEIREYNELDSGAKTEICISRAKREGKKSRENCFAFSTQKRSLFIEKK